MLRIQHHADFLACDERERRGPPPDSAFEPPRTPDHGRAVQARPRHRRRSPRRPAERPELFRGPRHAADPRGKGPGAARAGRTALRLPADAAARHGQEVRAPPSHGHLFRGVGFERHGRADGAVAARSRRGRARTPPPADRRSQAPKGMNMSASMLLEVVLKSSAVLLLASAATRLCGRWMSAAARHQVWAAALLVALLMPALMLYGPVWNVPFGSSAWADRATALWSRSNARLGTADVWPRFVSPASHAPVSTAADGSVEPAPARASAQTGTPAPSALPTVLALIIGVWMAGTLFGLLRLLTGMLSANAVVRNAVSVSSDWLAPVEEVQRLLGCRRAIRVLSSARTAVPVVCGIVRPAILLPIEAEAWDGRRRRAVLCH